MPANILSDLSAQTDKRLSLTLLVIWTIAVILIRWGEWAEDVSALYIAGWLWQNGEPELIYAAPPGFFGGYADIWQPAMDRIGIGDRMTFPYVYPPLWAALIAPLTTILGPQGFANAAAMIQFPLLAGSVYLAGRLVKPAAWSQTIWTIFGLAILTLSMPSYLAIWHNQPSIMVTFLILFAVHAAGTARLVTAGAMLALAAAIKLTPAVFVVLFLVERQWRALGALIATGLTIGLISLLLAGPQAHVDFLNALDHVKGSVLLNAVNTSLLAALLALASVLGLTDPLPLDMSVVVIRDAPGLLAQIISVTALALIALFLSVLRPWPLRIRLGIGLLALGIILPLFGPLGWLHYFLLPLLLLPGLAGLVPTRSAVTVLTIVVVLTSWIFFSNIKLLPWPVANYVWLSSAMWLAVLGCIYGAIRQKRSGT